MRICCKAEQDAAADQLNHDGIETHDRSRRSAGALEQRECRSIHAIDTSRFRVAERTINLRGPTRCPVLYKSKIEYEGLLARQIALLGKKQNLLYAHDRYSLLVIFQAMDAAGKDGVIKHVLSGVDPQGLQVFSFKQPSAEELDHDFLWRTTKCLPERGRIGVFNRSYYEEVLVVRVHPEFVDAQHCRTM